MNKHLIFGVIGLVIAAVLITLALGQQRAEAPIVQDETSRISDTLSEQPGDALPVPTPQPEPKPLPIGNSQNPAPVTACVVGGCSGQLCVEAGNEMMTTCEWREEYACYQSATCERQVSGECGWTPTPALSQCIAAAE